MRDVGEIECEGGEMADSCRRQDQSRPAIEMAIPSQQLWIWLQAVPLQNKISIKTMLEVQWQLIHFTSTTLFVVYLIRVSHFEHSLRGKALQIFLLRRMRERQVINPSSSLA